MIKKYWLASLFILGFFFRLLLTYSFPQPFEFDQAEYHPIALEISRVGLYTDSFRLYGYPLFMAIIYRIFGVDHLVLKIIQALLDTSTALLLFLIAQKVFKEKNISWLAYLLYLFNPFTSAYTGVFLAEIPATFLLTLSVFLLLTITKERKLATLILLALLLGYLPQLRPVYLYFSSFVLFYLIYIVGKSALKKEKKFVQAGLIVVFFIIPFLYNILGNLKYYNQFSPLTVDNLFVREFYISLFIDSPQRIAFIPKEVNWIYQEYSLPKETKQEYQAMTDKYLRLAINKVKENPTDFIIRRVKKMWFVWEKHQIFPYHNPQSEALPFLVYWGNVTILAVALFGFFVWIRKERKKWFAWFSMFLFGYISVLHAFSITDERFSIPIYPLIFLYSGYGLWRILKRNRNE